jgi:hypothetical protein
MDELFIAHSSYLRLLFKHYSQGREGDELRLKNFLLMVEDFELIKHFSIEDIT